MSLLVLHQVECTINVVKLMVSTRITCILRLSPQAVTWQTSMNFMLPQHDAFQPTHTNTHGPCAMECRACQLICAMQPPSSQHDACQSSAAAAATIAMHIPPITPGLLVFATTHTCTHRNAARAAQRAAALPCHADMPLPVLQAHGASHLTSFPMCSYASPCLMRQPHLGWVQRVLHLQSPHGCRHSRKLCGRPPKTHLPRSKEALQARPAPGSQTHTVPRRLPQS